MRLNEKLLRLMALDLPIYREIFSRSLGGFLSVALQKEYYGYSGRLRGMTFRQPDGSRPYFVGPDVVVVGRSRIHFSNGVKLFGKNFLHAGNSGFISIGEDTHVDVNTVLYGQGGLHVGKYCAIASGVIVYSQSNQYDVYPEERVIDQPVRYDTVKIGDDVWIGAGAVILPGVTIGDHAIVGAGAVVTNDVQPGKIVAGIPARILAARKMNRRNRGY